MVETICICGAGTMGSGITQVAALAGFNTIQYDISGVMLQKSRDAISANLDRMAGKQKITDAQAKTLPGSIRFTSHLSDCRADLFIEAIVEISDAKAELFNSLMAFNDPGAIFATNTSSLPVTGIQEKTIRPIGGAPAALRGRRASRPSAR